VEETTGTLLWIEVPRPGAAVAGLPVGPASVRILDGRGRAVPVGIVGDVCVVGDETRNPPAPMPSPWRGRWRRDGSLELTALREGLAAPPAATVRRAAASVYRAPRTSLERQIASVWQNVLGPGAGVEDDFFALGGGADEAVEISLRLGGLNLLALPGQIVEKRTVASLAPVVEDNMRLALADPASREPAPLTPLQQSILAASAGAPGRSVGCVVLRSEDPLDAGALSEALRRVALRHDALRLRVDGAGGLAVGVVRDAGEIALTRTDLAGGAAGDRRRAWQAALAAERLEVGLSCPSLRAVLARGGAGRGDRLALLASSLVVDEGSWALLVEEVELAYADVVSGRAPRLGEPPSFHAWLLAAERLKAFAEPETDGSPVRAAAKTVSCRLPGGAHAALRALSPSIREAALAAALRAVSGPRPVEINRDRRGPAAVAGLMRTIGQFGCLGGVPQDANLEQAPPVLSARLVSQPPRADREAKLSVVRFDPPDLLPGGADLRVIALDLDDALHLAVSWSGEPGGSLRGVLEALRGGIESEAVRLRAGDSAAERRFATVELDADELENLLT
jgi:Condensation domain